MIDFYTKSSISNGSMQTQDLIDYAMRNNIQQLGIVELETLPKIVKGDNIKYGTEILTDNNNVSIVIFDIKNHDKLAELLAKQAKQNSKQLIYFLKEILKDSFVLEKTLLENNYITINKAINLLISLGVCKDFKTAFNLLIQNNTIKRDNINTQLANYKNFGTMYLNIKNTSTVSNYFDLAKNFGGVLLSAKVSQKEYISLKNYCSKHSINLLLGSGFDNHKTGDIIGVDYD